MPNSRCRFLVRCILFLDGSSLSLSLGVGVPAPQRVKLVEPVLHIEDGIMGRRAISADFYDSLVDAWRENPGNLNSAAADGSGVSDERRAGAEQPA